MKRNERVLAVAKEKGTTYFPAKKSHFHFHKHFTSHLSSYCQFCFSCLSFISSIFPFAILLLTQSIPVCLSYPVSFLIFWLSLAFFLLASLGRRSSILTVFPNHLISKMLAAQAMDLKSLLLRCFLKDMMKRYSFHLIIFIPVLLLVCPALTIIRIPKISSYVISRLAMSCTSPKNCLKLLYW